MEEMLKQLLKKSKQKERRSAFTMIELLLVIAIIAVLVGIVMSAINIPGFLGDAYDAERAHNVNQLENAMYQHLVDNWEILNEIDIPEGAANAKDVCKYNKDEDPNPDTTCVDLDGLIPLFMAALPTDPAETNPNYTGYKVYKTAGRPRFVAAHLGKLPVEKDPLCDSSLVAYWKFDEDSGSNATDSSGNGNTGTLQNMEDGDWTTDTPTSLSFSTHSLDFDGVDEYVQSANNFTLDDFTISGWFNRTTISGEDYYWSLGYNNTNSFLVYFDSGESENLQYYAKPFGSTEATNLPVSANIWHSIAVVREGNSLTFYINDNSYAKSHASYEYQISQKLDLGFAVVRNKAGSYFNGLIDDVRIYNRALSASEIESLASGDGGCS